MRRANDSVNHICQVAFSLRQLLEFGHVLPYTSKGNLSKSKAVHEFRERTQDDSILCKKIQDYCEKLKALLRGWEKKGNKMGGIPRDRIEAAEAKIVNDYDLKMQAAPTIEITAQNLGEVRVCVVSKLNTATKHNECFFSSYFHAVTGFELAACYSFKIVPPHFLPPVESQSFEQFRAMVDEGLDIIKQREKDMTKSELERQIFTVLNDLEVKVHILPFAVEGGD